MYTIKIYLQAGRWGARWATAAWARPHPTAPPACGTTCTTSPVRILYLICPPLSVTPSHLCSAPCGPSPLHGLILCSAGHFQPQFSSPTLAVISHKTYLKTRCKCPGGNTPGMGGLAGGLAGGGLAGGGGGFGAQSGGFRPPGGLAGMGNQMNSLAPKPLGSAMLAQVCSLLHEEPPPVVLWFSFRVHIWEPVV